MKLVKQKTLYFSEGKSDKVYEVDICENQDLFVVNFRYGRRDANLREGTKTVFPVSYEEALKTFNKLVESKEKKGYSENRNSESQTISKAPKAAVTTIREQTILKYLQQAVDKTYTRNWKVSRIILRAGNLEMYAAASLIAKFLNSEDQFEQYNAITVLASFNNSDYNNQILTAFKEQKFDTISGRAACAFLLKFGSESDKEFIKNEVSFLINEDIINSLPIHFLNSEKENASLLYYAYIFSFDNDSLREKVYQLITKIPFKVNTFKSVRYIYRATQIIDDADFFSMLAKRMALNKQGYSSDYILGSNNNWITVDEEKKKKNPSIAFSKKTKTYFNSATYKKIYDLSKKDTETYIKYATKILCSLNDKEDNVREEIQYFYNYNYDTESYNNEKRYYPKYNNFTGLMYILYGASTRFHQQKSKWYYIEDTTKTVSREEVLPAVWNKKPNEVLQILSEAKSDVAVNFSIKIIQDNLSFLDTLSGELIARLVGHYHPEVVLLISDFLEKKYAYTQPEEAILIGILSSGNEKSVKLGLSWLAKYNYNYFKDSAFIVRLLLTNDVQVISYLEKEYDNKTPYNYKIDIQQLEPLFIKNNTFSTEFLVAINNLIGNTEFGKLLKETPAQKISELSKSQEISNKLFAINLAKYNTTPAYELFKDSFNEYITSENELLRKAGIEVLAHFSDDFLLKNSKDIVGFCFSEYSEVRTAIQPTIKRLVELDKVFKDNLLNKLLLIITEAEAYEGLHENTYQLLTTYFKDDLSSLTETQIFTFVLSKYEFAQNLGTPLFENQIDLEKLTMHQLVKLTDSDVFSIRQAIQNYFKENASRINYELEEALQIFKSNWQDVIDWSLKYFDEHILPKNWTVDLLLFVCDIVKKDVQTFGMKMITKHFSDEKGLPLLTKLQEHPTKEVQFFVTNYLNSYAKENPKIILELENYFKTSLFNINTNRATKTRVYSFLEEESLKNEDVAKMTIDIINTILDTKIITDRSKNIDILLAIAMKYPKLEIPLIIKEITNEV